MRACFYLILAIIKYFNLSPVFILTNLPRMSMRACFYLILAILNYFNLSSVFILTIMVLNFFL